MSKNAITISYAQSLLWLAFFMALMTAETNIVDLFLVDFVHGNPHRTQENALFMMKAYTPLNGIVAFIGTFLVFTLPQFFQAGVVGSSGQMFGDRRWFAALLGLPLTALLTWYCYDYLAPTLAEDYEHGLSLSRYARTLAIQTPVTLFSSLYLNARLGDRSKKTVLLRALAVTLVVGGVRGYVVASSQFQFL
jgi:Na+-driven multidrug efflux pump